MSARVLLQRSLALAVLFGLSGCAAHYTSEAVQDPYGFWSGLWHGMIFPIALLANFLSWVLSLVGFSFLESIEIIGRPNTGFWYYTGFVLGLFGSVGGSAR